ncbi:hypothetical protein Glove_161g37 [Diversispora epigaea]|uniref:Uncharacterized protein n=1 Tax=Diversispora epigaea TaxID=1348612 RepID=A0A397IRG5_9GLOM|nr:hypothetical protein Glove_161g37 [Diversispora epigaea]
MYNVYDIRYGYYTYLVPDRCRFYKFSTSEKRGVINNINSEKQELYTHILELIGETKWLKIENINLISKNTHNDLFLADSKAENIAKSKKIRSLESILKILKDAFSTQENLLKKESEILSLKSKIAEVEQIKSKLTLKVNEFECLKSEDVFQFVIERHLTDMQSNIIFANSNINQYFIYKKNMNQSYTREITDSRLLPLPKDDIEIISENSVREIEAMKLSLEILPLHIVASGIHKVYMVKNENVSIGNLIKNYLNYWITAHGKKNYNQLTSLNLKYPWMVCGRCHDTLQVSRDYEYTC